MLGSRRHVDKSTLRIGMPWPETDILPRNVAPIHVSTVYEVSRFPAQRPRPVRRFGFGSNAWLPGGKLSLKLEVQEICLCTK